MDRNKLATETESFCVADISGKYHAASVYVPSEKALEGYKLTEVGPIPLDWEIKPMGIVCEFSNGINANKSAYGSGVPFINVLEVIHHTHLHSEFIPGKITLSDAAFDIFSVRHGDVLFNRTSETQAEVGLASVYIDSEPVVFGGFVIRARFVDHSFEPTYVGYGFRSPIIRRQIIAKGQGAVRANIGQHSLNRVLVPVPPMHEQCAIAEALSDVDALITSLDKLIAKKRDIKQAAMQQLLTGKTRLPEFSDPWRSCTLVDLGSFSKGCGIKREDVSDEGAPCVRYGELYTRYKDYIITLDSKISKEVAATAQPIKTGDLLFAGSGETAEEIGQCAAYLGKDEAYAGGDIVILTVSGQNSLYLGHLMNHETVAAQKARFGQGDAVVHISARNLAQIKIDLPPVEEQAAIATILSDMDAEITALESRRDKTKMIKQGMMQQLLTGRVRLINPSEEEKEPT